MEGLLVLLTLTLLVLVIILLGRFSGLARDVGQLRQQLSEFTHRGAKPDAMPPMQAPAEPRPVVPPPPVITPPPTPGIISPPVVATEPEVPTADEEALARMRAAFPDPEPATSVRVNLNKPPVVQAPVVRPPGAPPPPPRPGFFERHPDLEKFIGENLINKIGIAVLVLGIGLLLNYAIGKELLSTTAQTLIGLGAGGLLVFFAHRLRLDYRAFSSVLVAGGIAIFYTSIWFAFHEFHLIGQTLAFIIMVAITGLAVALTLGYDRKELAVISLLGGFAAPFLASSGEGNYKVLFTYLLILDAGMLVLANYKKWYVINVLAFGLTALIMAAWAVGGYPSLEPPPSLMAFTFATAFFLVFYAMNLRYNLRHRHSFTGLDHTLLLVNTGAYYAAGMYFLGDRETRVTGLFTVLLGLFYLLFALYFHRREGVPRTLKLLLIGLVLTFISLAAPVQLQGSYITLFWAAEAVLLLWFAHRTDLRLVERGSVAVTLLMLLSLWMDLLGLYSTTADVLMRPVLNKAWITGMACAISLGATTWLLRRSDRTVDLVPGISRGGWSAFTLVMGIVVLYVVNILELRYQLVRVLHPTVANIALMGFTLLFLLVLERFLQHVAKAGRVVLFGLFVFSAIVFISGYYVNSRAALWLVFNTEQGQGFVLLHALAFVLMVITVVRISLLAREAFVRPSAVWNFYLVTISTFLVVLASQELDHVMIFAQRSTDALTDARRVGYPILWGIGSFLFMWYGMRQRMRLLRVIALCLFAITLLKLFLFDLRSLSEGGRVAAFIFLGALLLVISFMYNKLKGLFVDDATTKNDAGPAL